MSQSCIDRRSPKRDQRTPVDIQVCESTLLRSNRMLVFHVLDFRFSSQFFVGVWPSRMCLYCVGRLSLTSKKVVGAPWDNFWVTWGGLNEVKRICSDVWHIYCALCFITSRFEWTLDYHVDNWMNVIFGCKEVDETYGMMQKVTDE